MQHRPHLDAPQISWAPISYPHRSLYGCCQLLLCCTVQGVFGPQRSSLGEKLQVSAAAYAPAARYPQLLRRLVKSLPLFDPQQVAALGKNTYGGPLLQAMLRAAALDA